MSAWPQGTTGTNPTGPTRDLLGKVVGEEADRRGVVASATAPQVLSIQDAVEERTGVRADHRVIVQLLRYGRRA